MVEGDNNVAGTWTCSCGKTNTAKFCVKCGSPRPAAPPPSAPVSPAEWVCSCGKTNTGKFCVKCGSPRPAAPPPPAPASPAEWVCSCGKINTGKFCAKCGLPRPEARPVTRSSEPPAEGVSAVAAAYAAQEAAARKAAEEAAARKAAEEAAMRKAAEEAAARKAAEVKAVQETAKKQEVPVVSSAEADGNNGMMKKVAIGVAVLLLLIGAYFVFGKKKEAPPASEPAKVETKADTEKKAEVIAKTAAEKPMDPAVREAKLKEYAEAVKEANARKKQDATANEKLVFLVENVQRKDNDLVVSGHLYNGKKNLTIISVKAMELDIVLRDIDKELLNEKNIKYTKAFTGMNIKPLQDSELLTVDLPGKAPGAEFNNFTATVHDVHWEGIGK